MILNIIERLYKKKVDATGLAVFRIAIGCVLFWYVFQLFEYRHLLFDKIPYIHFSNVNFSYALVLWLIVIMAIVFGFYTRMATVINYVLSIVFFATITNFGNHMCIIFMSVNFLLMFTSVSNVISLDAVFFKLGSSSPKPLPNKVSVLNYYSFVFMALGLVYFVSMFDKLFTDFWQNGLVIWKFASVPAEYARQNLTFVLNNKFVIQAFAYGALFFEGIFIFICLLSTNI